MIRTQNLRTGKIFSTLGTYTTNPNKLVPFYSPPGDIDNFATGSFLLAVSGFTVPIVVPVLYKYSAADQLAFLFLPGWSGTANATTMSGLPLTRPLIPQGTLPLGTQEHGLLGFNNGTPLEVCSFEVTNTNVFTFLNTGNVSGWTNGGVNGINAQVVKLFLN